MEIYLLELLDIWGLLVCNRCHVFSKFWASLDAESATDVLEKGNNMSQQA